jgi:hypothetical protein
MTMSDTIEPLPDSIWLRHGEGKAVLLHSPKPATKSDMRRAGLYEDRADAYITGCIHGTGYRGVYSREYIMEVRT